MDADGAQFSPANTGQRHELEYVGDARFGDLLHGPYRVRLVQESLLVGVGEQGAQGRLGPRHRRGLLPAGSAARLFRSVSTVCGLPLSRAVGNVVTSSFSVNDRFRGRSRPVARPARPRRIAGRRVETSRRRFASPARGLELFSVPEPAESGMRILPHKISDPGKPVFGSLR